MIAARRTQRHEVKCWPQPFEELARGAKRADVRRCDDREYRRGDELLEREYSPAADQYSGRALIAKITHITRYAGELALEGTFIDQERGVELRADVAVLSVEVLEIGVYTMLASTAVLG